MTPTPIGVKLGSRYTISLLKRLRLEGKVAELSRPDASLIWIVAPAVASIRAPLTGEYAPGVETVVVAGGLTKGVVESLPRVRQALNSAGARL